ncbi:hypothetical protein GGX14DRAFT_442105 [Mycena pura]|uniref:Uncharacterized protein n=1 Tax=Mycena pura TaxID=153505 RepID=A0AAD6VMP3_9AGAR|nr:hypothetical protein GGX14DRAFT_442105 [Mycena pura]
MTVRVIKAFCSSDATSEEATEIDSGQLESDTPPVPPPCDHTTCEGSCWKGIQVPCYKLLSLSWPSHVDYPQSRFPNWTHEQVVRSCIHKAIKEYNQPSTIYYADVNVDGFFTDSGKFVATDETKGELWDRLINDYRRRSESVRMNGPVLQMLGARYNIEPFFFSSSLNWIPSRYEEAIQTNQGDRMDKIILSTFLISKYQILLSHSHSFGRWTILTPNQVIDTQAPLFLHSSDSYLILDLLAVHLIRSTDGNTIISYHDHESDTTAMYLHKRIRYAGQSVYWQNIFQTSPDPTLVLMTFIWHALYAWDEALEHLYAHICYIEAQVINTSDPVLTRELHIIRAHLLHYSALLGDFRKAVDFVRETQNPAMDARPDQDRLLSGRLLQRECKTLLSEIDRLEMSRGMQDRRLKNVMNLVFSSVNIDDSRRMQQLTEAAVRDSAAMKQIAYLTMVFLPSSFVAALFGMNLKEIVPDATGSWRHYFATALPLTFVTVWAVMAFQSKYLLGPHATTWMRLIWPVTLMRWYLRNRRAKYDLNRQIGNGWGETK